MSRPSLNQFVGISLAVAIVLASCSQPGSQPSPQPGVTPQITVQINPPATPGPSPTPRPLVNPILVDRVPAQGEELSVDRPIELIFDQPMDRRSVEQALIVRASDGTSVAGKLEWTSDNRVSFKPDQNWARAARYSVAISSDAKSAKGMSLARPESFVVTTVGNLAVAQTIPADGAQDVVADATITVLFNRPVVSLTTLAEQAGLPVPVTFNPPIVGRGQWLNTSIYLFRPTQPLQAGATYEGRVAAGLRDTTGALLESDYVWTFSVAAPVVKFIAPSSGARNVDLRQPISVTFSQKMDRASAEAAFSIEPPVAGTFRWGEEEPADRAGRGFGPKPVPADVALAPAGEVMAFVPGEDYRRGQTYTVRVRAGARAAAGLGATTAEVTTAFQVIPLPAVVSTRPANNQERAPASNGFSIRFSAPMSVPTILANLAFDPPITLTGVYSYYDSFDNEFSLNVDLKPSTSYRVRIGGETMDVYGVKIGQDTEVRFSTGPLPPLVVVQSNGLVGTYNAALPTQVFVLHRNVTRLDFELTALTAQQFFNLAGGPNSYENLRAFKPDAGQVARKWSVMTTAGLNESANYRVSLSEGGGTLPTGIYLLTVSAPELVALDRDFQPVRHIIVVTNVHIGLKRGDREGLAWVTNLNSGAPLPGVTVSFRDATFAEIASAVTDGGEQAGQAFVTFPEGYRPYNTLYALVGQPGGPGPFGIAWSEMSYGINVYDFNLPGRYQAEPHFAYLYTDRPIYRPGQVVFYKGFVRRDDDARYALPTDVSQVNLAIFNNQGQQVFSVTVPLNANGAFDGQFTLDNGAPTGQYYLQICVPKPNVAQNELPCSYYGISFLVAAYRAPEFEVIATTDKTDYLAGETINATFDAQYFFGGNVAGARVNWALLASDYYFDRYTGPGNYTFGDFDFSARSFFGFNELIASGEGVTDAQGRFALRLPADLSKRKMSARFTLEASVTDVNDQSVAARTTVVVHKGEVYFGVAPRGYVFDVGDEVVADVISVGWDGRPVADRPAVVTFNRRQWFTTQEQDPYGYLYYTSVPSDTRVFSDTVITDADGKATVGFRPAEGGEYHIVAAGASAEQSAVSAGASVYVSAPGAYVAWRVENNDRIELKADKPSYQVGETARVLVPSPFQGATTALLTVERGNFVQRKTITLRSNSDVLEIPITPDFAPNVYVSVLIVKGVSDASPVPAYRLGYTQFAVDPAQFVLDIAITPDRTQYAPRDTATYDIRVTDAGGNPVQAELSLALVDKAVLSLTDPNVEPILDAFYGRRPLSVRTASTLNVNVDRITEKVAADAKGGGGGGEAAADAQFTRRNFKDTAYWNAVVQTDADGRARVQIILPDNLTTWRMTARAVTPDTRVGEATNEVLSTRPLLVRPVTPRFFVVGDTVTVGAVVNNNTTADLDAQVAIVSTGLALVGGDAIQRVSVKAGGAARVNWSVTVLDAPSSEITMTVAGGGLQDSAQPGLTGAPNGIPILRYSAPETVSTAGDLGEAGRKLELVALPPRLDTGLGDLTVQVDTGLGAAAARGVQALASYPYESVDWVASRLIVSLALAQAGVQPAAAESLQNDVSSALQRLYGQQHSDGGWGWWTGDASDPIVSAHVVLAMTRAQQAGFSSLVDEGTLNRAHNYLREQLKPPGELTSATATNRQAYILFVQAEAGRGDGGRLGVLYENRARLGYYGKALLAMALDKVNPGDTRVKTLLADIQSAAITSATGASWQERERDWPNFFSDTRSTAIVLTALARLDPLNALTANAVRWLMAARSGGGWSTTQETEWAITAFSEWIGATGERRSAFDWRVTLNDRSLLGGQARPQGESAREVVAVADLLRNQANELVFERGAGEGRLYYTAHLRAYLPVETAKAINRGIVIARKYELADCRPAPDKPCEAVGSAKIGQNVRVRLTIVAPSDLYYVRVTDPLPGGAEAVDTSLKTSQTATSGGGPVMPYFGVEDGWGWWYFAHTELYDDRVAVFASYLPAGTYEYTYVIRPSIAGRFQVIPASVEQTYFPEVFGRSDGSVFTIER